MAYLKVLNVQQGDCMTIRPQSDCMYKNELFYVDLGNGQFDISKEIRPEDKIRLILTHSHRDHINGIAYMFPHIDQVQEIVLPYCFNEVWLIAKAIMNLRGMKNAAGCEEMKKDLIDIFTLQRLLKNLLETGSQKADTEEGRKGKNRIKVTFAYDGLSLCGHIRFLNPPLPRVPRNWLSDDRFKLLEEQIHQLFEEEFAADLIGYVRAQQRSYGVDHGFYRDFIIDDRVNRTEETAYRRSQNMGRAGCKIVLGFIKSNMNRMLGFNAAPNVQQLNAIFNNYIKTVHDACLVVRLIYGEKTFLLGGDASKKVFHRLIGKEDGALRADYFKIPHHGSDKNLDDTILQEVDPDVAIISHGNAKFGRAKDPHPNRGVLNMLSKRKITVLVTNDVVKDGVLIWKKTGYKNGDLEME